MFSMDKHLNPEKLIFRNYGTLFILALLLALLRVCHLEAGGLVLLLPVGAPGVTHSPGRLPRGMVDAPRGLSTNFFAFFL